MNPILKRVLKGLVATMLASGAAYMLNVLPSLTFLNAAELSLIAALLLGVEKALPTNF